jgi:hypothetical protein
MAPEIPPDGSSWQGLPVGGQATSHVQRGFWDNGDGVLSLGDNIDLDGTMYSITYVGPAYVGNATKYCPILYPPENYWYGPVVFVPKTHNSGPDPSGEIWLQLNPHTCPPVTEGIWHFWVWQWYDNNGNGVVDAGDSVFDPSVHVGEYMFITEVRVSIGIDGLVAVPIRPSTWGRIKSLFR